MECPKCKSIISDSAKVCPYCHKVLLLECPNCHNLGESAVCEHCGYTILTKCAKCGKINSTDNEHCTKCGFSTDASVAFQECESDEFAAVTIKINSLKKIHSALKSQNLYSKFLSNIKSRIDECVKKIDCKYIIYEDIYDINFNKELSFATSANKAVVFALKIVNVFADINENVIKQFNFPLELTVSVIKKRSENLQKLNIYESNVKLLNTKKEVPIYLKGMQVILDQYVTDEVRKKYDTDSLFSIDADGRTIMFYEVLLSKYVLPPTQKEEEKPKPPKVATPVKVVHTDEKEDIYSFNVFDINAKCHFKKISQTKLKEQFDSMDFVNADKVISLCQSGNDIIDIFDLVSYFKEKEMNVISVTCSEVLKYKPWGVFEEIFKSQNNISLCKNSIDYSKFDEIYLNRFNLLFNLIRSIPCKASTAEDARYAYMETIEDYLGQLDNTVIIIDGFENIDDTSLQMFEIYFEKFNKIKPAFIFIADNISIHKKIKNLLRTSIYTEFVIEKSDIELMLQTLKSDYTDFVKSFYFEKIQEYANGSYFYFKKAVDFLKSSGIVLDFEGKLIVKSNQVVVLPNNVDEIYHQKIKKIGSTVSAALILAYSYFLGNRIDVQTIKKMDIDGYEKGLEILKDNGFVYVKDRIVYINNYNFLCPILKKSMKQDSQVFLVKNILAQIGKEIDDNILANAVDIIGAFKEEYLTLWKNAKFSIKVGDYDAYLKNCLKFLSLIEKIDTEIDIEIIEENKKEVYNQILLCLYNYSPTKIYYIENILLADAIKNDDNEKIIKLSNLMLQGALISSNYTDALMLLHNILARIPSTSLVNENGEIDNKVFLLSLVELEILYNIGNFEECISVANKILNVISKETLLKTKPTTFSINLYMEHVIESMRLAILSKLYILDDDIEGFIDNISAKLEIEFPDKYAILAIESFLKKKDVPLTDVKQMSVYSKLVIMLLGEFAKLKDNYKDFAQNIYQIKLLALEEHQKEIELFCDLLIGFTYFKAKVYKKAESIYNDILQIAEHNAIFNLICLSKYFYAKLKYAKNLSEDALLLINDALALIRKNQNQSKILYVLFEQLYIEIIRSQNITSVNLDTEEMKIEAYKQKLSAILTQNND